jgi:acyl-[acyl-carrier-protein]-phospholipid O-acyltransferase / long-chain-fatty-acid--[acyl-carrier-protein] ligase
MAPVSDPPENSSTDEPSETGEKRRNLGLILSGRFFPYFVTQFLGAFNDNAYRFAFVMLATYRLQDQLEMEERTLVTLASGLFMLPFFIFSAFAGQLADKFSKRKMIRILKVTEFILMSLAAVGFVTANVWMLLTLLFFMGAQSAFFGPLKYGILPQLMPKRELLPANAWTQGGTFFAIILGTVFGSALAAFEAGTLVISTLVVGAALLGFLASWFIPPTPPADPGIEIDLNLIRQTWRVLSLAFSDRFILLCMLGISWFWFVGASLLAQFPVLAKEYLFAAEGVATVLLLLISVGVAIGAFLCSLILRGRPNPKYVPYATLVMTVCLGDVIWATSIISEPSELFDLAEFVAMPTGIRIFIGVFCLAFAGGFYTTPLYTLIQALIDQRQRARFIAASNLMNSGFMVLSAVMFMVLYALDWSLLQALGLIAAINVAFAGLLFVCSGMAGKRLDWIEADADR